MIAADPSFMFVLQLVDACQSAFLGTVVVCERVGVCVGHCECCCLLGWLLVGLPACLLALLCFVCVVSIAGL